MRFGVANVHKIKANLEDNFVTTVSPTVRLTLLEDAVRAGKTAITTDGSGTDLYGRSDSTDIEVLVSGFDNVVSKAVDLRNTLAADTRYPAVVVAATDMLGTATPSSCLDGDDDDRDGRWPPSEGR